MQPNGAFELIDMFNGALAKLWMIDIVIDIKFYSTVFLFAVFLLALICVADRNTLVSNFLFENLIIIVLNKSFTGFVVRSGSCSDK